MGRARFPPKGGRVLAFGATQETDETNEQELTAAELREQLAAERARREAAETAQTRDQQRLDSFLQSARQPAERSTQSIQPLGAPPDPTTDWEGYQRWLAEKDRRAQVELDTRLAREREEITRTVTEQTTTAALWARFQTKYPAYASRTALVRAAYVSLVDAQRLPADAERAVDAVKAEMDAMVGAPIDQIQLPADRTSDFSQGAAPRRRAKPSDEDAVRTTHESITAEKRKYGLI